MSLKSVSFYLASCDNCGASAGSFYQDKYPGPQYVTAELVGRLKWTAFDTTYHCYRCPPICSSCGLDDVDCDCVSAWTDNPTPVVHQTDDAAYVSREPNVIAMGDCPVCLRTGVALALDGCADLDACFAAHAALKGAGNGSR